MACTKEFLEQFRDISFEEQPFCDGDAVVFCETFYMPLEQVVSESFDDEPQNFPAACYKLFAKRGFKHQKLGAMITATPSKNLMTMAASRRYSGVKVVAVKAVNSQVPAIQFAVGTFILPDGTLVLVFRGTDDMIAGWKEDFDILLRKGTPAYGYAVDYIEALAKAYDGDIIVCGHSKGGNEALYTALKCSPETRARIKGLYNCDGPGFHSHSIFKTGAYDEILPYYNHYIPSSSFIGVLMAHDYDYTVVKSKKHLGPFQHDLGTWCFDNGDLSTVPDTDYISKTTDIVLAKVAAKAQTGFCEAVDTVFEKVTLGTGCETVTDLVKHIGSGVGGAVKAWKAIDPDTKALFKEAFSGTIKLTCDTAKTIKNTVVEEVTVKAFSMFE